jgi:hypothetical protein
MINVGFDLCIQNPSSIGLFRKFFLQNEGFLSTDGEYFSSQPMKPPIINHIILVR